MDRLEWLLAIALAWTALSVASFVQYGVDKHRARRGRRRIPEARLLLLDLLGGWPGALVGRRIWHHKTAKPSFRARFLLVVTINLSGVALVAWLVYRSTTH